MNRNIVFSLLLLAALAIGIVIGRMSPTGAPTDESAKAGDEPDILYWVAPMDPNYRRDEPGKSPMGMDLVPVYADEAGGGDPSLVEISPTIVNNLGVRTAPVRQGPLSRRVETVGYVGYNEDTLTHIHSRVEGWIESLAVKAEGDPVKAGQLLYQLYSPTLVNAQEEFLAALASGNRTLIRASRERLVALGVADGEVQRIENERRANRLISVFAESGGYATELGVREGIYITPATEVMSIAQLDEVWVLVEVFERQAAWIRTGQQAEVELDYIPGQSWQGQVDYVYPELDPETRTLKIRLRFDNESRELRPNMFARVRIFGSETEPVIHVPREALIRGGVVDRVVLALGDGRFRSQPVEVGIEAGGRVEITSGLSAGDIVVTSGQFLIDSESNIDSALARLDSDLPQAPPGRVRIGAVVQSADPEARTVTLRHDPVPAWSWPAMTMSFDVADRSLLEGLTAGQAVEIEIDRLADGRHTITDILPGGPGETPEPEAMEMDHGDHGGETMDHSQHDMEINP